MDFTETGGNGIGMARTFIATVEGKSESIPEEKAVQLSIRDGGSGRGGEARGRAAILDVLHEGRSYRVCARRLPDGDTEIWVGRYRVVVTVQDEREARLGKYVRAATGAASALRVKAPMPGLIKAIAVREGDAVTKGQHLLTLEAMKMENEITAPGDGVVGGLDLKPGTSVEKGQVLIELKKNDH